MEEKNAGELRGRHGCIAVPIVFVIGLFALLLIAATFAVWRRGDLRLPELGTLTRVGDGSAGVVAIAALALALMFLALVMMIFCCCRCKEPDLEKLLRMLLQPILLALGLIQTSMNAIAEAIRALTEMMATVIEILGTVAEMLRKLDVPGRQAPDGSWIPGSSELGGIIGGVITTLETGKATAEATGGQAVDAGKQVGNFVADAWNTRPR